MQPRNSCLVARFVMLHAIKHAHDHAMHNYTLLRSKVARHMVSQASGGAAKVPGATGTREVSPTIISRGIFDARALRMAYAQGCAAMRTREGAWGCARRGNAAHARRAHGRTRRGQQTRTRTCFRPSCFCTICLERLWPLPLTDSIDAHLPFQGPGATRTVWRFLLHLVCYRGVRAWCCLPPPIVAEAPSAALGVVRPARGQNRHWNTPQHASVHQRLQ